MPMQITNLLLVEIDFLSPLYDLSIKLRDKILREPLGLSFNIDELSKEDSDYHLGILHDGNLIACLVLTPKSKSVIKMRQVAVLESFQGQGIGRILVAYSESFSKAKGYEKIVLNARENAIPFYKKLAYSIEGDFFEEVTIVHQKMNKNL